MPQFNEIHSLIIFLLAYTHLFDSTGKFISSLGRTSMQSMVFSPDSTRLVFATPDETQLLNAVTGELIAVLACPGPFHFSPDSSRIIYQSRHESQTWNSLDGAPTGTCERSEYPSQLKYSLEGSWVVGSFKGQLKHICWLPKVIQGSTPVASSGGNILVLGNEKGDLSILDLSCIQWTS